MQGPDGPLNLLLDRGGPLALASFGALPGMRDRDVFMGRVAGARLSSPPGGTYYVAPAAVLDRRGALHVIWAEPDSGVAPDFSQEIGFSMRRLMYASYRGGHWTRAETVARAHWMFSYMGERTPLLLDDAGNLHLIFTLETENSGSLTHFGRGRDGWTVKPLPPSRHGRLGEGGAYPTVALAGGGRMWLGFITGLDGGKAQSVFIRESRDGGGTWSDPVLVHNAGTQPPMQLQLVHTGGDTLHMFWVGTPGRGNIFPTGAVHVLSTDGGRTWNAPVDVPQPPERPGIGTIAAQAGPGGDAHLVYSSSWQEPNRQLWHVRYHGSRVFPPHRLLPDTTRRTHAFTFVFDPAGRMHLLWANSLRYHQGDPPGSKDQRLSYAVWTPCKTR